MSKEFKKEISIARLMDFDKCQQLYLKNVTGGRRRVVTVSEIAGDAGHKLAAGDGVESAREYIAIKLADQPETVRDAVMQRAVEFSERAAELTEPAVRQEDHEVQMRWEDPVSGWTIFAKPDQLYFTERNGRQVMVIKDTKAGYRVSARHKKQIFLFGLVAAQYYKWDGWIDLVVSLPDAGTEVPFRYSRAMEPIKLAELRQTLRDIERAWETQNFPESTRYSCERCKFFSECPVAQAFIASVQETAERPLSLPVVQPFVASAALAARIA